MKVDNAVIIAAGTSSRFAPLSYERHKAFTVVKGEVLIERQIKQLQRAGVPEVYVVTGYKAEQFNYLVEKYGVKLIHNPDYLERNNNGSIWAAREVLGIAISVHQTIIFPRILLNLKLTELIMRQNMPMDTHRNGA